VLQQGGKIVRTTFMPKEGQVERSWYVIDASGKPLGRVASEIARILRGKHKPIFTPGVDTGDHVVVINAGKILLTGKKAEQKFHYRHSGYPGGFRRISYGTLLSSRPERVMMLAVKGMLPHNRLGRAMLKKIRVYDGSDHPHEAQQPVAWQF
jgi:large subunit ribosomal protein L13